MQASEVERGYWLMIASDVNCDILSCLGRPFYALNRSALVRSIRVGDRCALYRARRRMGFIGIYEVDGPVTDSPVKVGANVYSTRVPWKALYVAEAAPARVQSLIEELGFIRNKQKFGSYFQTNLRRLAIDDFVAIEREVIRVSRSAGASGAS